MVITITGWFITLRNQKKLINSQFEADTKKVLMELRTKNSIDYLNQIENWMEEGKRISYEIHTSSDEEILNRFKTWQSNFLSSIATKADIINLYNTNETKKSLGFWLFREYFYRACQIEIGLGFENRSGILDEVDFMNMQIRTSARVDYHLARIRSNIFGLDSPLIENFNYGQLVSMDDEREPENF